MKPSRVRPAPTNSFWLTLFGANIIVKSISTLLKTFYNLFVILGVCQILLFFGCSGEPDVTLEPKDAAEETAIDTNAEVTGEELLYEETFRALQQAYESPILDDRFETLHRISSDPVYFAFLRNAYPDVQHQDFKTFVKNSPPNAEVYEIVLHKHFGQPTRTDIVVAHRMHQGFQKGRILVYHRTDKNAVIDEVLIPAFKEPPIFGWAAERFKDDEEGFEAFDADFQRLSRDIEFGNIIKINKILMDQGNERRRDDGFIWLMLREPALMGQVLDSFNDTEIFLEWLKGEFQESEIRF